MAAGWLVGGATASISEIDLVDAGVSVACLSAARTRD